MSLNPLQLRYLLMLCETIWVSRLPGPTENLAVRVRMAFTVIPVSGLIQQIFSLPMLPNH
jgi:hypothetical protein